MARWRALQVPNLMVELTFPANGRKERGVVTDLYLIGQSFILTFRHLEFTLPGGSGWMPLEDHGFRRIEPSAYRIQSVRPRILLVPRWRTDLPTFIVDATH